MLLKKIAFSTLTFLIFTFGFLPFTNLDVNALTGELFFQTNQVDNSLVCIYDKSERNYETIATFKIDQASKTINLDLSDPGYGYSPSLITLIIIYDSSVANCEDGLATYPNNRIAEGSTRIDPNLTTKVTFDNSKEKYDEKIITLIDSPRFISNAYRFGCNTGTENDIYVGTLIECDFSIIDNTISSYTYSNTGNLRFVDKGNVLINSSCYINSENDGIACDTLDTISLDYLVTSEKFYFLDLEAEFGDGVFLPIEEIEIRPSCFSDTIGNSFIAFICKLKYDEIISGYPDGTYKPYNNVSRGEMSKFIVNAFNVPINTNCENFIDIPVGSPFYEEITSLKCNGIVNGYPDGTYQLSRTVSRGEMSKFIINASGIAENTSCNQFSDIPADFDFASYIQTLKCEEIINGFPDGTYRPFDVVSREVMAKFIDNARD